MRNKFLLAAASIAFSMNLLPLAAAASENKVALVPGGPFPYFDGWVQPEQDAAKDFSIASAQYKVPAEWKLESQTELLDSLAAQGVKAFGIFPEDAVGTNSTLAEFKENNIPSIAVAGCTKDPTDADFCLATDVSQAAYVGTKALIKAIGGKGEIVHMAGALLDINTTLREKAVERAVAETDGAVTLLQTVADTDVPEVADQKVYSLLAAKKDEVNGIISTGYVSSVATVNALRNLGDKRIKFVGSDDDKIVLDGIRDGFASGTIGQNPYGQAYVGTYALDLLASGCTPKADAPWVTTPQTTHLVDSGTVFISQDNVATYKDDLKALSHDMQKKFKDTYLSCK